MGPTESTNPLSDQPAIKAIVKKVATRAAAASTRLENRAVPTDHVRSEGVKASTHVGPASAEHGETLSDTTVGAPCCQSPPRPHAPTALGLIRVATARS